MEGHGVLRDALDFQTMSPRQDNDRLPPRNPERIRRRLFEVRSTRLRKSPGFLRGNAEHEITVVLQLSRRVAQLRTQIVKFIGRPRAASRWRSRPASLLFTPSRRERIEALRGRHGTGGHGRNIGPPEAQVNDFSPPRRGSLRSLSAAAAGKLGVSDTEQTLSLKFHPWDCRLSARPNPTGPSARPQSRRHPSRPLRAVPKPTARSLRRVRGNRR